jgi:hypothetical protein
MAREVLTEQKARVGQAWSFTRGSGKKCPSWQPASTLSCHPVAQSPGAKPWWGAAHLQGLGAAHDGAATASAMLRQQPCHAQAEASDSARCTLLLTNATDTGSPSVAIVGCCR